MFLEDEDYKDTEDLADKLESSKGARNCILLYIECFVYTMKLLMYMGIVIGDAL